MSRRDFARPARSANPILPALLAALLLPALSARADLTLVNHGTPRATIVVARAALAAAPEPTTATMDQAQPAASKIAAAARDLQAYIQKMSGAKLPIVGDDQVPPGGGAGGGAGAGGAGATLILVGRSALTKDFDAQIPSGKTPTCDEEGYAIITRGTRLLLAGNDEPVYHGTEYAVAEFLHRQGVRWYMPGEFGDFVPRHETIKAGDLHVISHPDFKLRDWQYGLQPGDLTLIEYRWKIRNGMNPSGRQMYNSPTDGSVRSVLPDPKELNNKALADVWGQNAQGRPNEGMPDLSSPASVLYAAEKVKEAFRKDPKQLSFGISGDDGMPVDFTPKTLANGMNFVDVLGREGVTSDLSISEEWMTWVQAVAKEVYKDYPDHFIITNGYANRVRPPIGVPPDPKIWIMFAPIGADTMHAYDNPRSWQGLRTGRMIKEWASRYKNVFMYDYIYYTLVGCGAPIALAHKHMHDMPLLKQWGVVGFEDEGPAVRGITGVFPTYLRARMMWNAELDGRKEMDEFFANWYGPAKKPAMAFWEELENAFETTTWLGDQDRILQHVYTPELVERMEKHLKKAEALATDPWSKPRVHADRVLLEGLQAFMAMNQAAMEADYPGAARQAQHMIDVRHDAAAISRFYFDPNPDFGKPTEPELAGEINGVLAQSTSERREYYKSAAQDLTTGRTGDMVAVLPERTKFKLDPRDDGRYSAWFQPDLRDDDWPTLRTTLPFYRQVNGCLSKDGYPYVGPMWYRMTADVPASAAGKTVHLNMQCVSDEAWVWVNGKFVGHRGYIWAWEWPSNLNTFPSELDMDVTTALLPGQKNSIVVRVDTGSNAIQECPGIDSRAFLYAAKGAALRPHFYEAINKPKADYERFVGETQAPVTKP